MPREETEVLDPDLRQGEHTSSRLVTPSGANDYTLEVGSMLQADLDDETNSIGLAIDGSFDGGRTWKALISTTWKGGGPVRPGQSGAPLLSTTLTGRQPDETRYRINPVRRQLCSCKAITDEKTRQVRAERRDE